MIAPFLNEFCSPVVVVTSTGSAEEICLKNGLLLHEILSSFGHLDGINATIRAGGSQSFQMSDAHIRFERETEVRAKTSAELEALLKDRFEEFDLQRLPSTLAELRSATPSAWTPTIEQILLRSLSFSECEMLSHPLVLMSVVSTTDLDAIACMQQLASAHHTPAVVLSGQYDPEIHRVYLLIHDASLGSAVDAMAVFRRLQTKFPAAKFLPINSLPAAAPNLQQPDMWSRWVIPKFFAHDAPQPDPTEAPPTNPVDGLRVLGSRLSMEDFMALREFCVVFFHKEVVPALERRIAFLTKQVNEARKGVKNVLKSFWRKPREASTVKGALRYTHDRIETQILLLADTSFVIKDYETAASMYRLVKEDYRSDKSQLHLAHATLLLAACHLVTDQGRGKELQAQLDSLREVMQGGGHDPPHAFAFFALLAAEMYVSPALRAPLVAAEFLLQAAASASRQPLLCSLLTEKAAGYFLQARQVRKFAFHVMLAGHKMHPCCPRARRHALTCFVVSMMVHEADRWNGIKTKLQRSVVEELKAQGQEGAQRALIVLLGMLAANLSETQGILSREAATEAAAVLGELSRPGPWGAVAVGDEWTRSTIRSALLGPLPLQPSAQGATHVSGLAVPEIDKRSLALMVPTNGSGQMAAYDALPTMDSQVSEELRVLLALESQWGAEQEAAQDSGSASASGSNGNGVSNGVGNSSNGNLEAEAAGGGSLAERWVRAEQDLRSSHEARKLKQQALPPPRIPLGERVVLWVNASNKLPVDLAVSQLRLDISPAEGVAVEPVDLPLPPNASKEVLLSAVPSGFGTFCAEALHWSLSPALHLRQPLVKPGVLLQKTLQQRATRERGPPVALSFEVVEAHPLLQLSLTGCSPELLQGELVHASLVLTNQGGAPACAVDLKFSQPCCVLLHAADGKAAASDIIPPWGQSSTIVRLPSGTVIAPGATLTLDAWLRFNSCGRVQFSALAAYCALRGNNEMVPFGPGLRRRTSFVSFSVQVAPSVSLQVSVADQPASTELRTLVLSLSNLVSEDSKDVQKRSSIALKASTSSFYADGAEEALVGGAVHIEGIYMLGAAVPETRPDASARAASAAPSERLTLCLPIVLAQTGRTPAGACSGHKSWLVPLSKRLAGNLAFLGVVTRALCSLYSTVRLHRLLREARLNQKETQDDEAPKTIQQVRRDKDKDRDAQAAGDDTAAAAATAANGSSAKPAVRRVESHGALSVFEFSGGGAASAPSAFLASSSQQSLASCRGVPTTESDLADVEGQNGSVNITVVWVCKWKGQIRRGIHSISQIPLYTGAGLSGVVVRSSRTDLVLVGVTHEGEACIPAGRRSVRVPVSVELRSVADEALTVSVEAEDPSLPCERAVRWEGKTAYVDVVLAPRATAALTFFAVLGGAGVYDLKRFLVQVSTADGKRLKKPFADNSFITCINAD